LFIAWGMEGFSLLTETSSAVQIEDKVTGMIYTQSENKFSLGLDLVALISLVIVGLGFVIINLTRFYYKNRA